MRTAEPVEPGAAFVGRVAAGQSLSISLDAVGDAIDRPLVRLVRIAAVCERGPGGQGGDYDAGSEATDDHAERHSTACTTGKLSQPISYSPIADVFGLAGNAAAIQSQQERAQAYSNGAYKEPYNTGMFGGSGSVELG